VPTLPALIDLSSLGSLGFIVQGDAAFDQAGLSVSSAGDVNGDGFDDLIVGAPIRRRRRHQCGEAYVIFGKSGGFATIDLTALASTDGSSSRAMPTATCGLSVSSAGDVNGDGYDDLIVGAPYGDDGGTDAAKPMSSSARPAACAVRPCRPRAGDGFIIQGDRRRRPAGWSVSSAGDVNGDGYDDLIVGAPSATMAAAMPAKPMSSSARPAGFATSTSPPRPADGFIIQGDAANDMRAGAFLGRRHQRRRL
jgi:hypothetical protein